MLSQSGRGEISPAPLDPVGPGYRVTARLTLDARPGLLNGDGFALPTGLSLSLPPGYRIARLPRAHRVEAEAFSYESRWSLDGGVLRVTRRLLSRVDQPLCTGALRAAVAKALEEIRRDHDAQVELEKEG